MYDSQVLFRCCEEVFDLCYYGANTLTLFSGTTCNQTEQEICVRAVKIILNLCILGYKQFNGSNFDYYADACKQWGRFRGACHTLLKVCFSFDLPMAACEVIIALNIAESHVIEAHAPIFVQAIICKEKPSCRCFYSNCGYRS
mmetsp:Transcript_18431/g.23918  ORF Transcript_18431/g.23918 Transcript_18431/m.23918 type:complete len:143 (+) Transcript_18431:127-555(+)